MYEWRTVKRKGVVRKGRLDEVPATPQKRDMSPVCRTPEKLERSDEKIVRWVEDKVGAQCFGKKMGLLAGIVGDSAGL